MSKVSDREVPENSGAPQNASEQFRDFVEQRYTEWEDEFGQGVETRRTAAFDPKY